MVSWLKNENTLTYENKVINGGFFRFEKNSQPAYLMQEYVWRFIIHSYIT